MSVPIRECTRMIRSRNAGSYLISVDFVFLSESLYDLARSEHVFDERRIAQMYDVPVSTVHVIPHDPSIAIKVTLPRQAPSGSPADTDIDSSQQYVPLLDLSMPDAARPLADNARLEAGERVANPSPTSNERTHTMSATTRNTASISSAGARTLIDGAVEYVRTNGGAFCIAVVDNSGVLKAFERMDEAPLISNQIAEDKAYTAAGFGIPTDGWYDFIKDDGPLALGAPTGIDRLVVFGGGMPIVIDGHVVGAVGVSGGHYTDDMAVAQAAIDALNASG